MARRWRLGMVLFCCVAVLVFFYRPTPIFSGSDNVATLLTARAILQHGTIKLDKYQEEFARQGVVFDERFLSLDRKNGHLYNIFPLGSSILSLPLVAVYSVLGVEALALTGAVKAQLFAVALSCVWVFLMLYLLARLYLPHAAALLVALAFLLGSSMSSTLGSSLWTHNFTAPLALSVLYLLVKALQGNPARQLGVLIGVLLFLMYLCRPTAVLFAPPVFLLLFFLERVSAYKAVATSVFLGLLFIAFSYYEFGQHLPDYYLTERLSTPHYWSALYGLLLSPSRGLFIFTPLLLFLLAFPPTGGWRKALAGQRLLLLLLVWPLLHLFVTALHPSWWGGHGYGPRLMMDVLPVVYLFLLLYVKQLLAAAPGAAKSVRLALLAVIAAVSIPMHSYQGLYNPATMLWNETQDLNAPLALLFFDWKYPQFIHTRARQERRKAEDQALSSKEELSRE